MANDNAEAEPFEDQPLDFSKKNLPFNPSPPPSGSDHSDGLYPVLRMSPLTGAPAGLVPPVNGRIRELTPGGVNGLLQQVVTSSNGHVGPVNGNGLLGSRTASPPPPLSGLLQVTPPEMPHQGTPPSSEEKLPLVVPSSRMNPFGLPEENGGLLMPALPVPMDNRKQFKYTRPFKAYPRDPLSVPLSYYGLHMTSDAVATQTILSSASDQAYLQFREQMLANKRLQAELTRPKGDGIPQVVDDSGDSSDATVCTSNALIPCSSPQEIREIKAQPSTMVLASSGVSRKRGRSLPDELKDEAYWERRRKNNEAAKRSRDARRAKEDEIAIRAAFLEQENLKLRVELSALKSETTKLRCLLYNS